MSECVDHMVENSGLGIIDDAIGAIGGAAEGLLESAGDHVSGIRCRLAQVWQDGPFNGQNIADDPCGGVQAILEAVGEEGWGALVPCRHEEDAAHAVGCATLELLSAYIARRLGGGNASVRTAGAATLSRAERLAIYFERLINAPAASSADDALQLVRNLLDQVEDEFSGVTRNPNPGLTPDGRMYPPMDDMIEPTSGGGYTANTRGHRVEIGSDGSIEIIDKRTGEIVFSKEGAG
jgi:hypothetical protein